MIELQEGKKVFILVGVPGSGKSTVVKQLKERYKDEEFVVINQDKVGSRDKCIDLMHTALESNKNVIVDRCNVTKRQRKYWLDVAGFYTVKNIFCLVLDVDPEEALARIHLRKNHETIKEDISLEDKRKIVYQFFNSYEAPEMSEGYSGILITRG